MSVALGIDTGGTYTDAALIEYETSQVLATAKALTTKHDLSIGIQQAIDHVMAIQPATIGLVSLSTTLATNAIVEGHGAPTCTFLIGYKGRLDKNLNIAQELGTDQYVFISGGHLANGDEYEPLDIDAARTAILEHRSRCAAFAISGYFGTRNPSHEIVVRRLITELTGLPATCGHELTHRLDALRRAMTVTLNARLIPLLCDLIDAVERTMGAKGISAPLMVVKGDGSLMESTMARERPIETILSGPAASVIGAQLLAGCDDSVVVDMGGTTTDLAVLTGGHAKINPKGARVGRWRTMVEAIDAQTVGIGGDSRVWIDEEREIRIGPRRVVPICLLAAQYPQIVESLEKYAGQPAKPGARLGEFLVLQRDCQHNGSHPPFERELMDALREGPVALDRADHMMRYPQLYTQYIDQLQRQGILIHSALTPTDATHVLGEYTEWDERAARLGINILAKRLSCDPKALCRRILMRTSERIAKEIVTKLLDDESRNGHHTGISDSFLLARALRPDSESDVLCSLTVKPALVAVGAPVGVYFPAVSNLLNGTLYIPQHTEVANAIGAVAGSVISRIHVSVVPQQDEEIFRVHLPDEIRDFRDLAAAMADAEQQGRALAHEKTMRAGGRDIRIQVNRHDQRAPVSTGWGEEIYLGTTFEITAIGRPRLALAEQGR